MLIHQTEFWFPITNGLKELIIYRRLKDVNHGFPKHQQTSTPESLYEETSMEFEFETTRGGFHIRNWCKPEKNVESHT